MTNPYAPPLAGVDDISEPQAFDVPADRGTRLGAAILDSVLAKRPPLPRAGVEPLTPAAQTLIAAYEALPPADQYQVAVEIDRRFKGGWGDVPEDTLAETADELLLALDREEDAHAPR